jgi:sucrose-6F-phosphate phosphohydrolase
VRRTIEAQWPSDAAPPDAVITALGTEIEYASGETDGGWRARFEGWARTEIDRVVRDLGFVAHASEFQTEFKVSYAVAASEVGRVETALDQAGLARRTIHSGDSDFDVIPAEAGKAAAMARVATCLEISDDHVIVAGDSGNDLVMFEHASKGIVVGNARAELRERVDPRRAYFAKAPQAGGILEALRHWQLVPERSER